MYLCLDPNESNIDRNLACGHTVEEAFANYAKIDSTLQVHEATFYKLEKPLRYKMTLESE